MTSTQTSGYSLLHRTAIAVCLGTGLFFAFRAATPDAQATAAVPAVTVSPTVDAAVPDTELTTCNIEDIQAGDLVLARDEHGQEIGLKPVKEVYKRTSFHLRHLTFESADGDQQTLSTTDEHPFWSVTADEFVEAGSLPVGHQVTDPHDKTQTLVSSTREEFPNGIPVFNFQVEDFHTYYVAAHAGDDVLLVHNADYAVPAYVGAGVNPIAVGVPTKNIDELIDGVDSIPQKLKGTISRSEDGAKELAEELAEKMGVPKNIIGPEAHQGGMSHFHIEDMRHWHFWF